MADQETPVVPTPPADQAVASPPEGVKGAAAEAILEASLPTEEAKPTPEQARIAALEAELVAARNGLTQAGQVLADSLAAAAARYRDLAAKSNPDVPAELIIGATIDQVDQSIEAGKAVVAKVRAQLAAQATAVITPGAPVRSGTDVESLSPFEKIKYAVAHRNNRR